MTDNPLAFPQPYSAPGEGMALRDWFAGQALQGLLAQTDEPDHAHEFARQAYVVADAMIFERAARNRTNEA